MSDDSTNRFWSKGQSDHLKGLKEQFSEKIQLLKAKLSGTEDPDEKKTIDSEMKELRKKYKKDKGDSDRNLYLKS